MNVGILAVHDVFDDGVERGLAEIVSVDSAADVTERIERGGMADDDVVAIRQSQPRPGGFGERGLVVRDLDAAFARLTAIKAPVVSRGGSVVAIPDNGLRAVVVQDPAGHFIRLVQPANAAATQPGTGDIRAVRVRHTVENLDRAVALYRDALGLQESRAARADYSGSAPIADSMGLPQDAQWRLALLTVPTSGVPLELIEFKGARRPAQPIDLADPGATRIQLRVADIDAAAAALVKAGGTFISTGGKPLDLPAGNGTLKVGVVRDPDGYFLVLINAPPAAR